MNYFHAELPAKTASLIINIMVMNMLLAEDSNLISKYYDYLDAFAMQEDNADLIAAALD
jgi:hypothetical protein